MLLLNKRFFVGVVLQQKLCVARGRLVTCSHQIRLPNLHQVPVGKKSWLILYEIIQETNLLWLHLSRVAATTGHVANIVRLQPNRWRGPGDQWWRGGLGRTPQKPAVTGFVAKTVYSLPQLCIGQQGIRVDVQCLTEWTLVTVGVWNQPTGFI